MDIAVRIEKKQRAILALLAPWFAFVFFHCGRGEKPLPPRIVAFATTTIAKLEDATTWLLIAAVYAALPAPQRSTQIERTAFCLALLGTNGPQTSVTIATLHKRLLALWRIVFHLTLIARHLARRLQQQRFLRNIASEGHFTHGSTFDAAAPIALPAPREKTGPP